MSILETNKIQPFDGDNITLSAPSNIQIQANLHVSGTVTAENFHTTTVQTTVLAQSGSTQLGNSSDDTHTIIGSVTHTGNSVQTGNSTLTGELTQSGDFKLTGDLLQTGNITLTGTGSVIGRVENTGEALHTGNTTVVGTSRISGSLQATGSINNVGFLRVTGSMETSGRISFLDYPWPEIGSETHILKTAPFIIETAQGNKAYDYLGIALEHIEDSLGENQHHSVSIYAYDNHDTPNYGSVLNVAPLRVDMQIDASGSDNYANVSVRDLLNGETQALMYADNIQVGVFNGDHIVFGNSTSNITSSADIYHINSNILHVISPDFQVTGSTIFSSSVDVIGTTNLSGTNTVSGSNTIVGDTSIGSIGTGRTLIYGTTEYNAGATHFRAPNLVNFESTPIFEVGLEVTGSLTVGAINDVSASIALNQTNITNLDTATSASDAALDTRVTTAESHIENLHIFTGSLDATYATDAQLNASGSFLNNRIDIQTGSLLVATGSINVNETNIGLLTALTGSLISTQTAYNTISGSYITSASLAANYVSKAKLLAAVTGSTNYNDFTGSLLTLLA